MADKTHRTRFELTAVDGATKVFRQVGDGLGSLQSGLDTVKSALAAVGVTIGVGAMVKLHADVLKATAALDDMAESTGASVENLSAIQRVAKVAGADFDGLTGQIGKMIKGLRDGSGESNKTAHALSFLGVSAKDASGRWRDTGDVILEVARKLDQYEDTGNKVLLVNDLLGKGAERYLPLLKDIAAGTDLHATVTREQAARAEEAEKNINRLKVALEDTRRELVNDSIPAIIRYTNELLAAKEALGGWYSGLSGFFSISGKQGDDPLKAIDEIDKRLKTLRADRDVLAGDSLGARFNRMVAPEDLAMLNQQIAFAEQQRKVLMGLFMRQSGGNMAGMVEDAAGIHPAPARARLSYAGPPEEPKGKTAADLFAELSGVDKDFTNDLKLLHAEYARGAVSLETYRAAVENLINKQKFAQDITKRNQELTKAQTDSIQQQIDARNRESEVLVRARQRLGDYIANQKLEMDTLGLSENERAKVIESKRIDLEVQQLMIGATEEHIELIYRWGEEAKKAYADALEAKQRYADQDARISDELERNRKLQDEARRNRDILAQSITDGIMRGFERGEGFWENFRNSIRNAVLTITVQPVVMGISQAIAAPFAGIASAGTSALINRIGLGAPGYGGGIFGPSSFGNIGTGMIESSLGVDFGLSTLVEDAAGNVTFAPTGAGSALGAMAPYLPYLPAALQLMRGDVEGAAVTGGLTYLGGAIGGPIGAVGGAFLGSMLGGGGSGDAERTSQYVAGFGEGGYAYQNNRWFSADMAAAQSAFDAQRIQTEQNLIRNLGLTQQQIAAVNQQLSAQSGRVFGFGMEHTPVEQSGAFQQIQAERIQAISQALGRSIEELTAIMSLSAEQFAAAQEQLRQQEQGVINSLAGMARQLPDVLGISGLEQFRDSLAVSEFVSPTDRFSAAREQYDRLLAEARGGDLEAIHGFPQVAQQLLGAGRDVYASGSTFQDLFREVNRSLNEVLEKQRAQEQDILRSLPIAIQEASQDQLAEIRRQTTALVSALDEVRAEIRRLAA
jgi:hypothetical protein